MASSRVSLVRDKVIPPDMYYTGEWQNNQPHGKGTLIYPGGDRYEGEFKDGVISGYGRITWADGSCYKGQWENGRMQGNGTLLYSNRDKYEGEFKDGAIHGYGKFTWADGAVHEGTWKHAKMHGKGVFVNRVGDRSEGVWENGRPNGEFKVVSKAGVASWLIYEEGKVVSQNAKLVEKVPNTKLAKCGLNTFLLVEKEEEKKM